MSNLQSGADKAQMIELLNSIKLPIMGAGGGFAPIGTINFFDASIAPQGWLACEGSTYNIADYPELATYYASVHGSANFYGGDGTTTFAVPDLRGEFLRGTGTNSHTNQGSGANVGVHQDGTVHCEVDGGGDNKIYAAKDAKNTTKYDSKIASTAVVYSAAGGNTATSDWGSFTSRPTNTSFLICVKATVAGDPNGHVYSTEEQVVGTDEDGNDVYEITLKGNVPANGTSIFSMVGKTFLEATGRVRYKEGGYVPIGWYYSSDNCIRINTQDSSGGLLIYWSGSLFENQPYRITVKYTKTTS